jgi:hypothetical protein
MIPSIILEEAKHFVTFMSSVVEELIGNEEFVLTILRNSNRTAELNELLSRNLTEAVASLGGDAPLDDPADKRFETSAKQGPKIKKPAYKKSEDEEDDYARYQEYMRKKKIQDE